MFKLSGSILALCFTASFGHAADFVVSGGVSTLGLDVGVATSIADQFGLRGLVGYGSLSRSEVISGNPADVDLTLGGIALLGDWRPISRNLTFSAGAFVSRYKASANSTGEIELNGAIYTGQLSATIEPERKISPMLAIGYSYQPDSFGWSIGAEVGAIFVGGLVSQIDGTTNAVDPTIVSEFNQDLNQSRSDLETEIDGIEALPFLRMNFSYRF